MYKVLFILIFPFVLFSNDTLFISKKWQDKEQKYQESLIKSKCKVAIKESKELLAMDPSSTKAMFYLLLASKKCNINPPLWLDKPTSWPNATVEDKFYIDLSKSIK